MSVPALCPPFRRIRPEWNAAASCITRPLFPSLQIEETGRGTGSSATVAAAATHRGAVTGTISMSSTGTRTTTMGTGDTWMPTVLEAIGPTTCPGRDLTISTAATGTTGGTEIITTGAEAWETGASLRSSRAVSARRGCRGLQGSPALQDGQA